MVLYKTKSTKRCYLAMKTYTLYREQRLDVDIDTAWDFFSDPMNLDLLTPDDMGFHIVNGQSIERMYEGQTIQYKVAPILNIPLTWHTKITDVDEPKSFTDQQMKGPYKLWVHKHTFLDMGDHVIMKDELEYAIGYGILGNIAHSVYVKARLKEIFDFRYERAEEIFNQKDSVIGINVSAFNEAPPTSPPSTSRFANIS